MNGTPFETIEETVTRKLRRELPKGLYFHSVAKVSELVSNVKKISLSEGTSEEEKVLLALAALYKNTGFTKNYKNYLQFSKEIAKEELFKFGFPNYQVEIVLNLIEGKPLKRDSGNRLLKIMSDADFDHFWRNDFFIKNELLRLETQEYFKTEKQKDVQISLRWWNERSLKILESHKYLTKASIEERQKGKEYNIRELKELLGRGN
jgi:hypothetical protein